MQETLFCWNYPKKIYKTEQQGLLKVILNYLFGLHISDRKQVYFYVMKKKKLYFMYWLVLNHK